MWHHVCCFLGLWTIALRRLWWLRVQGMCTTQCSLQQGRKLTFAGLGCSSRWQGRFFERPRKPCQLPWSQQWRHQFVHWILGFSCKCLESVKFSHCYSFYCFSCLHFTITDISIRGTAQGLGLVKEQNHRTKIPRLSHLRFHHSASFLFIFCNNRLDVRRCTIHFHIFFFQEQCPLLIFHPELQKTFAGSRTSESLGPRSRWLGTWSRFGILQMLVVGPN
jgi:hypothetical protein